MSPKKPPPENLEQILSQSRNRRALGHDGLLKRNTQKTNTNQDISTKPQPIGKQNPMNKLKKSRLANADIQFECDTSISLSDTDFNRKTPSPKKPAPKRLDTKKTPEDFDQQCRRSMRTRTIALAGKFGNAIPISTIETQNIDNRNVVCQIDIVPTPEAVSKDTSNATPQHESQEVISLSSSVECVEIQLESDTPENVRASSQQKDNVLKTPTQACERKDSTTPAAQQQMAINSRYVIDRPPQATTPDATFLKSFDAAMNVLNDISAIKIFMTFKEREKQHRKLLWTTYLHQRTLRIFCRKHQTRTKPKISVIFFFKKGEGYPVDSKKTQLIR